MYIWKKTLRELLVWSFTHKNIEIGGYKKQSGTDCWKTTATSGVCQGPCSVQTSAGRETETPSSSRFHISHEGRGHVVSDIQQIHWTGILNMNTNSKYRIKYSTSYQSLQPYYMHFLLCNIYLVKSCSVFALFPKAVLQSYSTISTVIVPKFPWLRHLGIELPKNKASTSISSST